MKDLPCYFCHLPMVFEDEYFDQQCLRCINHDDGEIWVYHYYLTGDILTKIWFNIKRSDGRYCFSLRFIPKTTVITFLADRFLNYKEIARFDSIPDNLIPETASERLSFYLTYM
jgi:hypothetical protein